MGCDEPVEGAAPEWERRVGSSGGIIEGQYFHLGQERLQLFGFVHCRAVADADLRQRHRGDGDATLRLLAETLPESRAPPEEGVDADVAVEEKAGFIHPRSAGHRSSPACAL